MASSYRFFQSPSRGPGNITEYIAHSWYDYAEGRQVAKHPFEGETNPRYTGPKPPYEHLEVEQKYSWLKAPRYQDKPMEVGPLARLLVAYASGQPDVKTLVDSTLATLKAPPAALFSTLGRIAARALRRRFSRTASRDGFRSWDTTCSRGT